MAAKKKEKEPVVKKIKAYPFEGAVDFAGGKRPLEILVVTDLGFIANVGQLFIKVGEYYQVSFEFPVIKKNMFTKVRALKTYDQAKDPRGLKVDRLAEFHFQNLTSDHRENLIAFLAAVGHPIK